MIHADGYSIGSRLLRGASYAYENQMEAGFVMSLCAPFQEEKRAFPFVLSELSSQLPRLLRPFHRSGGRSNRLDLDQLPESLQRDLGLTDGRVSRQMSRECHDPLWRAASLMHLPRGL